MYHLNYKLHGTKDLTFKSIIEPKVMQFDGTSVTFAIQRSEVEPLTLVTLYYSTWYREGTTSVAEIVNHKWTTLSDVHITKSISDE